MHKNGFYTTFFHEKLNFFRFFVSFIKGFSYICIRKMT